MLGGATAIMTARMRVMEKITLRVKRSDHIRERRVRRENIKSCCRGASPVINHPSGQKGLQEWAVKGTRATSSLENLVGSKGHYDRVV